MTTNPKSGQSHLADEADGELNFQESVLDGRITVTLSASDVKRAMSPSMKREKVIEAGLAQTDGFKAEDGLSQASDKLKSQNPDLDVEKVESQVSGQVATGKATKAEDSIPKNSKVTNSAEKKALAQPEGKIRKAAARKQTPKALKVDTAGSIGDPKESDAAQNDKSTATTPKKRGGGKATTGDDASKPKASKAKSQAKVTGEDDPNMFAAAQEDEKNKVDEPTTPIKTKKARAPKAKAQDDKAKSNEQAVLPKTPKSLKAGDEPTTPKTLKSRKAGEEPTTPKTPRGQATNGTPDGDEGKASSSKKRAVPDAEDGDGNEGDDISPTVPKKRRANDTPSSRIRKLPASYEEANEADKMLWDSRKDGVIYSKIREDWEKITGEKIGASTLPNRFERLKANFTKISAQKEATLVMVVREVEAKMESDKWIKVADILEADHEMEKLSPKGLEKTYKEIMKKGRGSAPSAPAADVEDSD